jgi:uncharacterized membrane protein YjjB (DUF3815 family)
VNLLPVRDILLQSVGAFAGTLGYAFMLNAPVRTVLPASLTALLGYMLYAVLHVLTPAGEMTSYFVATVVITVICELEARYMRMPSTIFLLTALVPLVPGYTFYCAMLALVENNSAAVAAHIVKAIQIVAVIAIGAAVVSVLFRTMAGLKNSRKH